MSQHLDWQGRPLSRSAASCPCSEMDCAHVHSWTLACPCGVTWAEGWPDVIRGPMQFEIPRHDRFQLGLFVPCDHAGKVVRARLMAHGLVGAPPR